MKIFVINLEQEAERRKEMRRQLDALGAAFEFVAAVDGRSLSAVELAENYDTAKAKREREVMTLPEIGCALSHLAVYRKVVAENLPGALILEDDAKLSGDTLTVANRLSALIPPDEARVVLLNHVPRYLRRSRMPLTATHSLVQPHSLCWCAHGYFVTRTAAARLLDKLHPVWITIDHWRRVQETDAVTVSAVTPFVVSLAPAAEHSSIANRGVKERGLAGGLLRLRRRYCHVGLPAYLWRKFVRMTAELSATVSGNVIRQDAADGEETAPIHIVFAPDKNFAAHTGVALASVIRHCHRPAALRFYILFMPGAGEEDFWADIRRRYDAIARLAGGRTEWIDAREQLSGLPGGWSEHLTPATFARLLIPDLLPQLERCLYLDGDLVALDDVAKLWAVDVSAAAFGAGTEMGCNYGVALANFPSQRQFFNAGVLLMNLPRFRARDYGRKCLQLARETEWHGGYADQDVLHVVCGGDCQLLDNRWNIQTGAPPSAVPGIAHFTGRKKPWHFYFGNPYGTAYWRERWRTPFRRLSAAEWADLLRSAKSNLLRLHLKPRRGIWRLTVLGRRLIDIAPAADGEV
jgi:glycosyl transferase family 25